MRALITSMADKASAACIADHLRRAGVVEDRQTWPLISSGHSSRVVFNREDDPINAVKHSFPETF